MWVTNYHSRIAEGSVFCQLQLMHADILNITIST